MSRKLTVSNYSKIKVVYCPVIFYFLFIFVQVILRTSRQLASGYLLRILHNSQYWPNSWVKTCFLTSFQKQHLYTVHLDPYLSKEDGDLHYKA